MAWRQSGRLAVNQMPDQLFRRSGTRRGWAATLRSGLLCLAALLSATPAFCDDSARHTFWEVTGRHNKLWLFGSVHVLQAQDALPQVAMSAYANAETIVEEVDLNAAMTDLFGGSASQLQMLPEGKTLAGVLGPALYARLQQEGRKLGIDPDFMSRLQPWYVALQVQQQQLMRIGFNPLNGVDMQIAVRAQSDGKPLQGLETVADQLSLFANLSLDEQREMLRATLDEKDPQSQLREIIAAWRGGDTDALEKQLRKGAEESPELFRKLTTDRNLRWLPQIEKMLQDPKGDYLVVTGALHMVGRDGLVELLRRKGYRVEQK
jgi:uncharacterized protein YbaP (TraB family)